MEADLGARLQANLGAGIQKDLEAGDHTRMVPHARSSR